MVRPHVVSIAPEDHHSQDEEHLARLCFSDIIQFRTIFHGTLLFASLRMDV
jgi:hypothetical protein